MSSSTVYCPPDYSVTRVVNAVRRVEGIPGHDYVADILEGRPLPMVIMNSGDRDEVLPAIRWHLDQPREICEVSFPANTLTNPARVLSVLDAHPPAKRLQVLQKIQMITDSSIVLAEIRNWNPSLRAPSP